jgi:hypothetical protein
MDDQPEAAVSDLLRRLLGSGGAVIGFPCVRCGADACAPEPGAKERSWCARRAACGTTSSRMATSLHASRRNDRSVLCW